MKIALYSTDINSFHKNDVNRDCDLHVFPEFFLKEIDNKRYVNFINYFQNSDSLIFSYSKKGVNYLEIFQNKPIICRPKSVGFGDERILKTKISNDWSFKINNTVILPLICYEIYFPEYPCYFKNIDLVTWSGVIKYGQKSWFKSLIKIRAMDFGCPIVGTIYPWSSKNNKFHLNFLVYPLNTSRFDIWENVSQSKVQINKELYNSLITSHNNKAMELFKRKKFGPFKKDLDEDLFNFG